MANNNAVSNVVPFIIRNTEGAIDINASVDNFHAELDSYVKTHRVKLRKVADSVNAVFDEHRGTPFSLSAITSFTLQRMGVKPENYDEMGTLIREYLKSDPNFEISRGRGGGVTRLSDAQQDDVEETAEDEEEQEEAPAVVVRRPSQAAPRNSAPAPRASAAPPARQSSRPSNRAAAR